MNAVTRLLNKLDLAVDIGAPPLGAGLASVVLVVLASARWGFLPKGTPGLLVLLAAFVLVGGATLYWRVRSYLPRRAAIKEREAQAWIASAATPAEQVHRARVYAKFGALGVAAVAAGQSLQGLEWAAAPPDLFSSDDHLPKANIDGTPMVGYVDIHGHAYGQTSDD